LHKCVRGGPGNGTLRACGIAIWQMIVDGKSCAHSYFSQAFEFIGKIGLRESE
jgi:hypothetical protein